MGVLLSFEVNPTTESTTFLPFSVTPYDITLLGKVSATLVIRRSRHSRDIYHFASPSMLVARKGGIPPYVVLYYATVDTKRVASRSGLGGV